MSRYRRAKIEAGAFFFTIALADQSDNLLVRHIDRLRQAYKFAVDHYPFETVAICILPDHMHAIWSLPKGDLNFSLRWSLQGLLPADWGGDVQMRDVAGE
jgi:putative transposase